MPVCIGMWGHGRRLEVASGATRGGRRQHEAKWWIGSVLQAPTFRVEAEDFLCYTENLGI